MKHKFWGGFREGKLDMREIDTGCTMRMVPAIFYTRKEARQEYEDVRPVKIFEIRKPLR